MDRRITTFDLTQFDISAMLQCGMDIRHLARDARTMEEAGQRIVRHLHEVCIDPRTQGRSLPLVRLYRTHPFGDLPPDLARFARDLDPNLAITPATKCLTLLATAGERPEWNQRQTSVGHRAIPLVSEAMVSGAPMIAGLIKSFGLEIASVISPDPAAAERLRTKTYDVFHVEQALGSPHIPAQAGFVVPYQIRSVVGFGGVLPDGELIAVIMFSRAHIPREAADRFRSIALDLKASLFRFEGRSIFS